MHKYSPKHLCMETERIKSDIETEEEGEKSESGKKHTRQ